MKILFLISLFLGTQVLFGQVNDSEQTQYKNTAELMLEENTGLAIGGYGEVHYNQPLNSGRFNPGTLDAHRLVMFLGYNFSSKTQFVSEIEFEYAKEVWVEQMFLQQKINKYINLRAGILLIPMGIINEYHEPVTFNGVERPVIDNKIAPSTWREIGAGISGNILQLKSKYQLYVVNGLNGYDAAGGVFSGSKTLREGRQKGSKAYITSPSYTGKVEFYGAKNLNIGISGYAGKSQSRLYTNLDKSNTALVQQADSSVVGIAMLGLDARYTFKGIRLTGQFYQISISNTEQYNRFTTKNGMLNDLGSALQGYYAEIGYNVFRTLPGVKSELMPFVRYEAYNTHHSVDGLTVANKKNDNVIITTGLTYALTKGAVLKADLQFLKSEADTEFSKVFNAGFGIMF